MDLYKEILAAALAQETADVTFPHLKIDPAQIVEQTCYQALRRIQNIIRCEDLSDGACFRQIEEIVTVFEEIGGSCGNRHDFG